MKLEVGMYVRTKKGMSQYKEYNTTNGKLLCMPLLNGTFANIEDIAKASHNIIDLIEVGDYVNGSEVLDFENKYIKENDEFVRSGIVTENCYLENTDSWIIEKDIKSIVTKEQFKAMEYRLGDK